MNPYRVCYEARQKFWGVFESPNRGPSWHGDIVLPGSAERRGTSYWLADVDAEYPGDAILTAYSILEAEGVEFNSFKTEAYRVILENRHPPKRIWWAYPINPRAIQMDDKPKLCWWDEGEIYQIDVKDAYPHLAINYAHNAMWEFL